jgi:hypothetical protein
MAIQTQPRVNRGPGSPRATLRIVETRRRRAKVHLVTYVVGNALFWGLWAALSVTADHWYWWPLVPLAGWTLVLVGHIWHVHGS